MDDVVIDVVPIGYIIVLYLYSFLYDANFVHIFIPRNFHFGGLWFAFLPIVSVLRYNRKSH